MEEQANGSRPLRVDAERNLRRLLDAAREAFAERGLSVSIDEIARRAGVGKGTVFRRFPTKEHLVAAIVCDCLDEVQRLGASLLAGEADRGFALRELMFAGAAQQAQNRGFFESAAQATFAEAEVMEAKQRLIEVTAALLAQAQREGLVREDVTPYDVLMLQCGAVQAAAPFHGQSPELWRRYLDIAFDGLRPEAAHALSHPAPEAQLSPQPAGA